jgi:hypothetical protein
MLTWTMAFHVRRTVCGSKVSTASSRRNAVEAIAAIVADPSWSPRDPSTNSWLCVADVSRLSRQPSARGISETCVGAGPGAISPGNSGIFAGAGAGTGSGGGSGSGSASAPGEPTTVPMAAAIADAAKRRRTRLMANSNYVDGYIES